MDTSQLEELIILLADSKHACDLIVEPNFVKNSKAYRDKMIENLEIPTFQRMKKIMFYDTIQKLVIRLVRMRHVKDIIAENRSQIQTLEKVFQVNICKIIQNFEVAKVNCTWQRDFDKMLMQLDEASDKIELIEKLRSQTDKLRKEYSS